MTKTQEQIERATKFANAEWVGCKLLHDKDFKRSWIGTLNSKAVGERYGSELEAKRSARKFREHAKEFIKPSADT